MVPAVVRHPPQWATLGCTGTKPSTDKLHAPAGLECVVAKFAVIEARYSEATHQVDHHRDGEREPANSNDKDEQARKMNSRVRKREFEEPSKTGLIVFHRGGCNQLNSSGQVPELSQEPDLTIHAVESITRISAK